MSSSVLQSVTSQNKAVKKLGLGGYNSDFFDWEEVWYPVFYVEDLDKSQPTRFTLLEQDIVLWWDKHEQMWRAFVDQCPHRLAPLSEGRINQDGRLECPYHGWAFSGTGQCEVIPQQKERGKAEISQRACVNSLPTKIAQGLLFVYPGLAENAAKTKVPIVDALEEDPDGWVCLNTFRDLPYDALTLMENVLDPSHIPYTHHRSVGNRANVSPVELEVVESGKCGFKGVWAEGPRKGTLGRQDTTFIAPGLMWHDLTSKQFGRTLTVVYATPIRKGECRLFARFPFKFSSKLPRLFLKLTPRWYSHIGQNNVLEDDQIFLHYQERYIEQQGGSGNFNKAFYLPTKADLFVFQLRFWVNHYSIDPFPGKTLPPSLPKEVLLERYHSHTQKCASCRGALGNLQRLRLGLAVGTALVWVLLPLLVFIHPQVSIVTVIILTVAVLMSGGVWLALGKLERQFYKGREIPPRNWPEKVYKEAKPR
ncbi:MULTISPECIES: Rieske 2Fe-2S domain-containing protein [Moorena]|uniref:Phenylpropionate dioxygenase family ring-hydroxylating dioxygenase, large terminal subunit n=1 Tax=Moorena producens 3L TaxID=489825 RepID=F4XSL4_9CYAN|nr:MULTISPECIES: Rieske 2Fe-2S domain-containing protein [Moorena]EGJ32427.1 phenylpropionate dioxygenase family ring-hydroxylating dioxygenase, large terminal subunit [Moorena producens 3L]NEP64693.1 Rieske 2Fe-2S domain-containing protein [Moorena sp. SIO3A5]OLT65319.1 cell death suppressor protein Lls1 [Moorena producens 3L]